MKDKCKKKKLRKLNKLQNLKERRKKLQKTNIVKKTNQNKFHNNKNLQIIVITMMMLEMIKENLTNKFNKKQFKRKYLMEKLIKMK